MSKAILGSVLLAMSIACTGCSSGGDGEGGGGSGGGGGSNAALSFDAATSLPAAGGAAAVMVFATQFGNTVSSIFEALVSAPGATSFGVSQKINLPVPGFCGGGGTATLDVPNFFPETWVENDVVSLDLDNCAGSVIAAAAASGTITLTISSVSVDGPTSGPSIGAAADVDLTISPGTEITGAFEVLARVSLGFLTDGRINFRLGAQRDEDLLTVTEGGQVLRLGCFDIDLGVSNLEPDFIAPLGVADLAGQIYTVNDYAQMPSSIFLDDNGVPTSGELTLFSGDQSEAGGERSGPCFGAFNGNTSQVTATFFDGGCIELNGVDAEGQPFQSSTTWDKLLDRDFTSGSGGVCGGGAPITGATPGPMDCDLLGSDVLAAADAYIQGDGPEGNNSDTPFGNAGNLVIKTVSNNFFTRKIYIVFDLLSFSDSFTKASLVLTLQRHVVNPDPAKSGPQPVNVFGITDDDDWDPAVLAEDAITWSDAPRNVTAARAQDAQFDPSPGVLSLIAGYDFDLGGDGVIDDPGTRYALDITKYVEDSLKDDADGKITILMAASNPMNFNQDGSAFFSLQALEECDRPFLHFE